jgi:hypothetical protein
MDEANLKPVDILNKKYNELVNVDRDQSQSLADFINTLEEKDARLCRIMTWYYKIFQSGYQKLLQLGFNAENALKLQEDLLDFSSQSAWPQIEEASLKIPNIIVHISKTA